MKNKLKAIAIHLPQFHPFAENDEWWGKGFTEWTNVTKAKPLFKGHYQPHLPTDLGFYDLRLDEARLAQEALAKEHGIFGFCYYHYWFNGKRLLNEPIDRKLKNPKEDFPFMLCWANENWTRRWDGEDNEVLIDQKYSFEDHINHASQLCETIFKDDRYIKVENKPVFIFYKAALIPEIEKVITIWRDTVKSYGFDGIYLLCMDNFIEQPAEEIGFDGAIHFHPDHRYFKREYEATKEKLFNKLFSKKSIYHKHHIETYSNYYTRVFSQVKTLSKNLFPGITPMWDNTARKAKDGIIFKDSSPILFGRFLRETINNYIPKNEQENFLFINAWNEWAEGNHLEPCIKYGNEYLKETVKALTDHI